MVIEHIAAHGTPATPRAPATSTSA